MTEVAAGPDRGGQSIALRRRRLIVGVTVVVGTTVLSVVLRLEPEDPRFHWGTAVAALVWFGGAALSGRPPVRGDGGARRAAALGVGIGAAAAVVCLLGGLVAAHIPLLRDPAEELLAHMGSAAFVVVVLALVNGVAEEFFFRGVLFDVLPARHAVVGSAAVYAVTTLASGVLLLPVAAVLLGLLTAELRRRTGGILAPVVTHLTWSSAMIVLLPPVLASGG